MEGVKRAMRLLDGRVDDVVLMACSMTDGSPEALLHGSPVGLWFTLFDLCGVRMMKLGR